MKTSRKGGNSANSSVVACTPDGSENQEKTTHANTPEENLEITRIVFRVALSINLTYSTTRSIDEKCS